MQKIVAVAYDYSNQIGWARIQDDAHAFADDIAEIFLRLDPNVRTVYTFIGPKPGSVLVIRNGRVWQTFKHQEASPWGLCDAR